MSDNIVKFSKYKEHDGRKRINNRNRCAGCHCVIDGEHYEGTLPFRDRVELISLCMECYEETSQYLDI